MLAEGLGTAAFERSWAAVDARHDLSAGEDTLVPASTCSLQACGLDRLARNHVVDDEDRAGFAGLGGVEFGA